MLCLKCRAVHKFNEVTSGFAAPLMGISISISLLGTAQVTNGLGRCHPNCRGALSHADHRRLPAIMTFGSEECWSFEFQWLQWLQNFVFSAFNGFLWRNWHMAHMLFSQKQTTDVVLPQTSSKNRPSGSWWESSQRWLSPTHPTTKPRVFSCRKELMGKLIGTEAGATCGGCGGALLVMSLQVSVTSFLRARNLTLIRW